MARLIKFIFLLLFFSFALYLGSRSSAPSALPTLLEGIHPEKIVPLAERKSFVFFIYAKNCSDTIEKSLGSVFAQEYEPFRVILLDDASSDATGQTAQTFIIDNNQENRTLFIQESEPLGFSRALYRVSDLCLDREILIPLHASEALLHPRVLSEINLAYQNNDVWMFASAALHQPSYQLLPPFSQQEVQKKGYSSLPPFCTFYAGLLKQVPLEQVFWQKNEKVLYRSLFELSGGRIRSCPSPLILTPTISAAAAPASILAPLASLSPLSTPASVDLILFSFDRPLQLHACLESAQHYTRGLGSIYVLYRASDPRFQAAYQLLVQTFPNVHFLSQGSNPRKDFKPLLLEILGKASSPYLLLGVDDTLFKDPVDLISCASFLERTGSYAFFLRFGRHIQKAYVHQTSQHLPPSFPIGRDLYAWDFRQGEYDWAFPHNLDLTLYRKSDLLPLFEQLKFRNPNTLEEAWAKHPPRSTLGLYFHRSRILNLPLNQVNPSDLPHMNCMTAQELLLKYEQGYRLNYLLLEGIENLSPHHEWPPAFMLQESP
jgi:hypothetical protein